MTKDNRRSDAIRARRTNGAAPQRSTERKTAPERKAAANKLTVTGREQYQAPVLVRGAQRDLPLVTRPRRSKRAAAGEPRRRYDVALSVPGAEIRLPSMPQVEIGWRWLSLVLVAVFGWLLYFLWTSPSFQVKPVEVSGLERVTNAEVNQILGVSGEPIFVLNPADLEEQVRNAFPEFSKVAIKVQFPDTVQIEVAERVPVVIWNNGGQASLIDQEGYAFPLRYELTGESAAIEGFPLVNASGMPPMPLQVEESSASVPVIPILGLRLPNAGSAPQLVSADMVRAVQTLSVHAPQGVELVYENRHGLGWQDERGWVVFFGDASGMEMKLRIYDALVARLAAEEVQPELISVEQVHAPYYRLEH